MSESETPPKPGTKRFKDKAVRPAVRPRVVAAPRSGGEPPEADDSQIRRRVTAVHAPGKEGWGLRWKIAGAMMTVVVLTALFIFFVVYDKALTQLNDSINLRGTLLVEALASMDKEYWVTAIHSSGQDREADLVELIQELAGESVDWRSALASEEWKKAKELALDPFGPAREEEIRRLLTEVAKVKDLNRELSADAKLERRFQRLVHPLPRLTDLKPLRSLEESKKQGLYSAGVADVTDGLSSAPTVTMAGLQGTTLPTAPAEGGLVVRDSPVQRGGETVLTRMFARYPSGEEKKLVYFVFLDLKGIEEAKAQLRLSILLPVLVTAGAGIGIAFLVASRITNPLKVLVNDIHEVSGGNLDHVTRVVSKDEIGQLAATFQRMTLALKTAHEQELDHRAKEHELNIANEIQANLLPKRVLKIPGFDVSAYYRPSEEVGGDYYDFIPIDDQNVAIIVADVSGKGVPGSLVMSMARAFIRMEAERGRNLSPRDTLIHVNRMLAPDIKRGMFVTALYGILNLVTREFAVTSAGHNPMVLWKSETDKIELVNTDGFALGFIKGPVFEQRIQEIRLTLAPGDRLVMYTDGTVEAMNEDRQEFGDTRFYELCRTLARRESNEFINLMVRALDEHKGGARQHDDMTMVTLRVT